MLPSQEIVSAVELLASDNHGLFILANALDSLEEKLIEASMVREIISDFSAEKKLSPSGETWASIWFRTCQGLHKTEKFLGASAISIHYLRRSKQPDTAQEIKQWRTVLSFTIWNKCHLEKKSNKPLLPFPLTNEESTVARFKSIVSSTDWLQKPTTNDGAWLGYPLGPTGNCWISCNELDASHSTLKKDLNGSSRRVVEALGMLPKTPFDTYVRYILDAQSSFFTSNNESGKRPNFADQGNEWFRVKGKSARASHYGTQGWGSTVHLSACRANKTDDTGRPERVVSSFPMSHDVILSVDPLFPSHSGQSFTKTPNQNFRRDLFRGRSKSDILAAIFKLWDL